MKTHAVQVFATGGADVLTWGEAELREPGPGEALVDVAAAGVNFIDVYQREGLYPLPMPLTLGQEGAGTVRAVGPGVDGVTPGQRVAWLDVLGSYAQQAVVRVDRLVAVPDGLELTSAAAAMLQGATAHYLATDTFRLGPGHTALVHAAAGGVGALLVQLAVAAGARVIGTVGSAQKEATARAAGATEVINYRDVDFADEVERRIGPHGVDVVYDGVGQATFAGGLRVLRPRGLMVSFGNASGAVDPVPPLMLASHGSLYLTRPALAHYVAGAEELQRRCGEVLDAVRQGRLRLTIGLEVPLAEAANAHTALEGRRTTGKVLLLP